ncbi:MAG: InlB B-repeat-containing protein, partial [Bacilli bacterium]|nr:InlB B-repeat-containing protein [Bacilli bacterium]
MKDTLKKLSRKKVIISAILVILFVLMIGLITVLKPVNKTIKISKVLTNTKTLSASVIDGVFEGVTSNNYDEIKYQIKVNKDDSDTAIVTASLTSEENKYARFKEIKDGVVTNNGKEITITTTRSNITITVIVENAPYGVTINPKININSEDETKSKINVDPVTITGKSVEGIVSDENGTLFSGIELSLLKNGTEVKRTYTKEDGKYVFSLGDLDTYEVRIAETKYKLVRYTEETTDQNRRVLNLVIKEVEPFTLNIKKTISKLDLVVNGKKEVFNYDDETKVVKVIKNAKTIEGSIYYNISIKNEGEVKGTVAVLKDIIPDGLSFDETKNPGWTKEDNYLFYTPLEGTELNAFEKTSAKLVLDIAKTDEAKSYINKAIASGDDYKYIVYYLNGNVYKEEYVINSEKIENIDPHVENFAGWYTDRNYTNKYNFDNAVTKDIALYGKIDNNKFNVMFIDINPNNNSQTILDIKEVPEGESVDLVDHPEYNGYTFKCFTLNGTCYNDEEIVSDTELYTSYTINNYDIEYDLDDGTVAAANPTSYTVKDTFTLNNPTKEGFTFLGWTGTGLSDVTETVTVPVGSTGKRTYTAHYEINRSTLTIDPNGGAYESNTSLVTFTENFGTLKVLSESERRGYNFLRYDHDGGGTYNNLTYL